MGKYPLNEKRLERPMKFTLVSDLHADFPQPKFPYELCEEDIVIAGDTSNGLEGLQWIAGKMRNKGYRTYSCPGNHENYANLSRGRDIYETEARFREDFPAETELPDGTPIVLRTGWYVVSDEAYWQRYMNDSKRMSVNQKEMNYLHFRDAEMLRQTLQSWKDYQKKGVVVTHMAPCEETLNPEFAGSTTNEWYWSPGCRRLLEEFSEQILVWCHGHTHAKNEAIVDGVRVVCNPRGYPGENPDWRPMTIEIN